MTGPLHYCFAYHAHWVGEQALHVEDAFATSIRALLTWQAASGARGALSCDAAGLEHLAARAPELLAELRLAMAEKRLEWVGASYAQPCGLLHGGESNIRQLQLGLGVSRRLLGVRPALAWESSFTFQPQAPQLLVSSGFAAAGLFHAWSARSPHTPVESAPTLGWVGLDGGEIAALAHTALCVQGGLDELRAAISASDSTAGVGVILQWLDASAFELVDPQAHGGAVRTALAEAPADANLLPSELASRLRAQSGGALRRRIELDETFVGLALGKNGDYMPRFSRSAEEQVLAAEGLSALASMFGRPYASGGVYPTWELDEAWRELCVGQHHIVHEREGACGAVGERAFERAIATSSEVFQRTLEHLGRRVDGLEGTSIVYNPLGWTRDVQLESGVVRSVPAFGYKVVDPYDGLEEPRLGRIQMELGEEELILRRGAFAVHIDRRRGVVTQLFSREFPEGALHKSRPVGQLEMRRSRSLERFETVHLSNESSESAEFAEFAFLREGRGGSRIRVVYSISTLHDALWVRFQGENLARPDAGVAAALTAPIAAAFRPARIVRDAPYGVCETEAERNFVLRQPLEDDANSARLETLTRPFTAYSFVDLLAEDSASRGLLVVHDGSQGWSRDQHGVRVVLNARDAWDGEHFDNVFDAELWLVPHGSMANSDRVRLSMECNLGSPRFEASAAVLGGGDLPPTLGAASLDATGVLMTALRRQVDIDELAPEAELWRAAQAPFVVRLVEFDGKASEAILRLPGPIARAAKTDLCGRVLTPLVPRAAAPPFGPSQLPWSALVVPMRPYEIATVMVELEFGRPAPGGGDALLARSGAQRRAHYGF